MKISMIVSCLVIATFVAVTASAQTATAQPPTVRLSPEAAACLRACAAGGSATKCPGIDAATKALVEKLAADIRALQTQVAAHSAALKNQEARLKVLEATKEGGTGGADIGKEIADLRTAINTEVGRVDGLKKAYDAKFASQDKAIEALAQKLGAEIDIVRGDVIAHQRRIEALEEKSFVNLGARGGIIVLVGLDKSLYSGMMASPRLTMNLTKNAWIAGDLGPVLSFGRFPTGMYGRVGVGYDFSSGVYGTLGGSGAFVGYNESLKAQAFYLAADAGVGMRFGAVDLSANILAGPKLAKGSTDVAFGGVLQLGVTFK